MKAHRWLPVLQRYQGLAGLLILIVVAFFIEKDFLTKENGVVLLRQLAIPGVLAIGMTFVILTGGIDLSVGSHLALLNVILATWIKAGTNVPLSCLYVLAWATLIGALLGWLVGRLRMQPFVVTLGGMASLRGLAYIYSHESIVSGFGDALDILQKPFLGLPISGWILIFLALVSSLVLHKTVFGRRVYAIGGSVEASRYAGVPVNKTRIMAYAVNGLCVGIAAILLTARTNSGQPNAAEGYELDAITAVVVGGASLMGGIGNVFGTCVGALFIVCVNNLLQLKGVDTYIGQGLKGAIILIAVYMQGVGRSAP
jgi:ribose/xylose/arabinose/galactoside ABC-type transport system permease subunit